MQGFLKINKVYNYILDKLRKGPGEAPQSKAAVLQGNPVPFAPGRIYLCRYSNWKHDSHPLLWILGSDYFYTHAININYLNVWQNTLLRVIMDLRLSNKPLTGWIIYRYLKMKANAIVKMGYRKYFTRYLLGKLVSDGVSQMPTPGKALFVLSSFVRRLNLLIKPRVINKVRMTPDEAERIKREMGVAEVQADQSRRGVVQPNRVTPQTPGTTTNPTGGI
jgi:hypothetical protein